MRPVALGRKSWIHPGSPQAGPKVAAILSVVESCRRLFASVAFPARAKAIAASAAQDLFEKYFTKEVRQKLYRAESAHRNASKPLDLS
jgi:hypothetical protein